MTCYREGGCGPFEMYSCNVCPASRPEYLQKDIVVQGVWVHFKGGLYQVLFAAKHTETGENMVVYRSLDGEQKIWVRPASMWEEEVEDPITGSKVKRFRYVGEYPTHKEGNALVMSAKDWAAFQKRIRDPEAFRKRDKLFAELEEMKITRNPDGSMEVPFTPKEREIEK